MSPRANHLLVAFLIPLLLLTACNKSSDDSPKAKGIEVSAAIVTFCSQKENRYEPTCIQVCIQDSTQEFCAVEAESRFTCPTDGNYKGVSPFSGDDVALPEILTALPIDGGDLKLGLTSLGNMIISTHGSNVTITTDKETTFNVGPLITSVAAVQKGDTLYVVVGTPTDFKVIPVTIGDEITVYKDQMKSFTLLGGIAQVVAKPSIDLSGAKREAAPGVATSVNAPEEGVAQSSGASDIDFIYLVTADGDVWRSKISHLVDGGCLEKLYSASIHLDSAIHKMAARKIDAAGQYLVILASTLDAQLTEIPTLKQNWKSNVSGNAPEPILNAFYRFAHKLALPQQSEQKIYTINLMTSEDGNYEEVGITDGSFITDIYLAGDILNVAAYAYDLTALPAYESTGDMINDQIEIWNAARAGTAAADEKLANFIQASNSKAYRFNLANPESLTSGILPKPDSENTLIPSSLFLTVTKVKDRLFFRGEDGYLAEAEMADISAPDIVSLDEFIAGSPYLSIYHSDTDTIFTSFILDIESLSVKDLN